MATDTGTFIVDKNESEVTFDGVTLTWITKKKPTSHQVAVRAVLGVECGATKAPQLTVHYLKNKDRYQLTLHKVVLKHEDLAVCQQWTDLINAAIHELVPKRPRRLLAFVNPISGGGHGASIFQKKVVPLLKIAQVEFELIETKHALHSKEVLAEYDLTTIDGIVVAGGDGSVLQTTSALLHRNMADAGRDVNDPNCDLVCTTVPIGIIPAGSGQSMITSTTGIKCLLTAIARIILGEVIKGPVMSVFNEGNPVHYANFMSSFAMFADMIHKVEQQRRFGRARYLIGVLGIAVSRLKEYDFEVEVVTTVEEKTLDEKNENTLSNSQADGGEYSEQNQQTTFDEQPQPCSQEGKKTFKDRIIMANVNLAGSKAPGYEPKNEGNMWDWMAIWRLGYLHVSLMEPTSKGNLFKFVKNMVKLKSDALDEPYITNFLATRVLVRQPAIGQDPQCSSCVNLDGEPTYCTNPLFDIRSFKEKILYFGVLVGENVPFLDPHDSRS